MFIFEIVLLVVSVIVLFISCYTDVRTREIPDFASWGLVGSALLIRLVASFFDGWGILISGLIGFGCAAVLGLLMYYTHQWGGGDAKLLFGFGAVIGVSYPFTFSSLLLGLFALALFFGGAVWGLGWMLFEAMRCSGFLKKFWIRVREHKKVVVVSVVSAVLLSVVCAVFGFLVLIPLTLFVPFMLGLFFFVKTVEKECFIKDVSPLVLTPGDWLVDKVQVGSVVIDKRTLDDEDVEQIKKWFKSGLIKTVRVKYGIPFAPSFVVAYAAVLYVVYVR